MNMSLTLKQFIIIFLNFIIEVNGILQTHFNKTNIGHLDYTCVYYKLNIPNVTKIRCSGHCSIQQYCLYFQYISSSKQCVLCSWKQMDVNENDVCRLQVGPQSGDSVYHKLHVEIDHLSPGPKDCTEHYRLGHRITGLYTIQTSTSSGLQVYCDMENNGGGWLVFQRRLDGGVNFYRNWAEYKVGFGNNQGEFWLGNDHIADITETTSYELRIDLQEFSLSKKYAVYSGFNISKSDDYRLWVGTYSGDAGDSMSYHNGFGWTTYDVDNDADPNNNCASRFIGAWWYKNCHGSNLNGEYNSGTWAAGVVWDKLGFSSLKASEMKIREIDLVINPCDV